MLRAAILEYVKHTYDTEPDYPWWDSPEAAVLRHGRDGKWYGLLMAVARVRLGLPGAGTVGVLNLKCPPELAGMLRQEAGIFPGYHMNKEHWISVLLDGTVPQAKICQLIDLSYDLTRKKTRLRPAPPQQP